MVTALACVVAACAGDSSASSRSTTSAPTDRATTATTAGSATTTEPATVPPTVAPYAVPAEPPPVYVLVLDELPLVNLLTADGDLNATRFPNMAALAARATWYTNWTIHSGRTIHSVPALLSGVLPENTLATAAEYPTNVITGLSAAGWNLHVAEHNSWLCPETLCPGRLPYPKPETRQAADVFGEYVGQMRDRAWAAPTLHLLHLALPHPPWTHLPDGTTTGSYDERIVGSRWSPGPWMGPGVGRAEALWQLGYADLVLGQWIDAIEARGEWDDALVVVTADHGEDLQPGHNSRDIRADNQRELVWVPAFVKLPGQRDGRVDADAHTATELAGMVYDALGVPRPGPLGEQQRVVVTDVWPYEDGAPLSFGPVDESARPHVTGRSAEGPGWGGLVDRVTRAALGDEIADLVGEPVPGGAAPAGEAQIDLLHLLEGVRRGECGWDVGVSGNLPGAPDPAHPYVALGVGGTVVGVAPLEAIWPGAGPSIEERPSYFRVLVDPDTVDVFEDVELFAVTTDARITGRYDLASSPYSTEMDCPH